jgi:hypothetical protein
VSFIVGLYVREGLVLASDSRTTYNDVHQVDNVNHHHIAVGMSDSAYKTFVTKNDVGISTYGTSLINGAPIGGLIRDFVDDELAPDTPVDEVAKLIQQYFKTNFEQPLYTGFLVAGYKGKGKEREQQLWDVWVPADAPIRQNDPSQQGLSWRGETDVVTRLIQPTYIKNNQSGEFNPLPYYQIQWAFFTLQDAVDFAVYAIESTIELMRFQPRPRTVGGPVDVLAITPEGARWVHRKELGVSRDFYNPFD